MKPLHELRALVLDWKRRFDAAGPNDDILIEGYLQGVERWVELMRLLDKALTDKTDCRDAVRDREEAEEALLGGRWLVYLSDGGYSRLEVHPIEGVFGIDRFLSRQAVIERWDALEAAV